MERAECIAVFSSGSDAAKAAPDRLLLPQWGEAQWSKLFGLTRPRPFRASEMVIRRGATDRCLYFVAAGSLEVGVTIVDGVSIAPLARIGAGSVIGEQSFFDGEPRSANVWGVAEGELLQLEYDDFVGFAREEPALARDFLFALGRVLSSRLRNTTFRVRR
ncbi:MAG TPA: cyclic nucleotide-binding domain-containing protein [Burkholderiales bacterium]|nr:cyclic nucleotide-binding domain-containing protein [Burkholderiales bacterium]